MLADWMKVALARIDAGTASPEGMCRTRPELRREFRGILLMTEMDTLGVIEQEYRVLPDRSICWRWARKGREAVFTLDTPGSIAVAILDGVRPVNWTIPGPGGSVVGEIRNLLGWLVAQKDWDTAFGTMSSEDIRLIIADPEQNYFS